MWDGSSAILHYSGVRGCSLPIAYTLIGLFRKHRVCFAVVRRVFFSMVSHSQACPASFGTRSHYFDDRQCPRSWYYLCYVKLSPKSPCKVSFSTPFPGCPPLGLMMRIPDLHSALASPKSLQLLLTIIHCLGDLSFVQSRQSLTSSTTYISSSTIVPSPFPLPSAKQYIPAKRARYELAVDIGPTHSPVHLDFVTWNAACICA